MAKKTAVDRMVEKFGGTNEFAAVCQVDPSRVRHWRRPASSGGNARGGAIPDIYHARIIAAAKARRIKVNPAELVNV